ncbi:MAG: Holliday junction branch migration protein RuvA [Candidatus Omnitrophota bacterium]
MITRISGTIAGRRGNSIFVEAGSMCYEVMVPLAVMRSLERENSFTEKVEFVTYHYYQMEPSRAVPMLIGFRNDIEKEFFEKFISVSGVGPRAACRALAEPFSEVAGAIDSGDIQFLKRLPGIGEQRARLIVAKLQGKVGKYGLIRSGAGTGIVPEDDDVKKEALAVLLQLQYKRSEAEEMIQKVLERGPEIKTSEELLNEVYRQRTTVKG